MKRAVKKYSDTDIFISTSFSYTPWKYTNKKKVLFCDWTISYYYDYFLNRTPDKLEQKSIERQNVHLQKSDYIISLFPNVSEYIKKVFNEKAYYIGNVINSELDVNKDEILKCKRNSNSILFVGGPKYIEGARCLINSFEMIQEDYPELELNIIGINKKEVDNLPERVNFYGYLNKSNHSDRETYYNLMKNAKVIVNTTPKWAAFSGTVEAMYWYTPVITTPYTSFIETFGSDMKFGYYCERNDPELLKNYLENILTMVQLDYVDLCINANSMVQKFTWDNYVTNLLQTIEENPTF
ncbi:group 1 glycosyl transferase [Niallia nealsonii AAU1]|nr:group 1 glycosyl transferase [Niallia nealsonii AAU1]